MNARSIAIAVGVVAAMVMVGLAVQTALDTQSAAANPQAAVAAPAHKPSGTLLERLPCFGCHNIEHFRKGNPKAQIQAGTAADEPKAEFSHTLHEGEGVGHCHMCHAFEGHFQVVIRKETCAGCH